MAATRLLSTEFPIHITARSNNRERFPIPLPEVWEILEDQLVMLNKGFGIQIINFVLMPNHFHMIVLDPLGNLSNGMEYFMRESSREIGRSCNRINRIWGAKFHSTVIASSQYFFVCYRYTYRNPVTAGLAQSVLDYEFSSLRVLLGHRKSA